ncbi:MAG: hypothetical protein JO112_00420 [Planctomycetes bacterium]|nr:hypothetical protein [Planctomycetota bacterium]
MGETLWWMFGSICAVLAVLKLCGTIWCSVELHRNWQGCPELWALDWLDIVYRVQREFGVALTASDFDTRALEVRTNLTAGKLWELVASKLQADGRVIPRDGWDYLVALLSESLNVKTSRICPESRLYADLGMLHGLE